MTAERALLGTQDLHCHTTMSDGDLPLEEVVALAAERGVTVGISDHVSGRNPERFVSDEAKLRDYFRALENAPVFRAGELCWCDAFSTHLPADLLERFDYLIGSNHGFALPDGGWGHPWLASLPDAWADRPQGVMDVMVHNLCDLVRTMPIQIVAHSTLTPPVLLKLEPDVHAWWTEEREDRFVDAVVESGVALEISNRYRLPHDRLLRKARQAGARFSLGSDGHTREQVARLDWAVETAHRVGITDAELFVPEGRRPGAGTRAGRGTGD
ncbi:MAG TPA: PHP domain-containing protein [Longimicrobiaceae bacterium]|nr:PHP domain-containing protein [Longimicrobiaceae bacterium]